MIPVNCKESVFFSGIECTNVRKKITLCAVGSRGEIQPYIYLGLALKQKGYQVKIATENRLKNLVEEFGIGEKTILNSYLRSHD